MTEKKLGLGRHSLVALSLLLGSDYSHGIRGFGPETACQVIRSISEDVVLQRIASEGISFLKSLKTSKKHGQVPENHGKENCKNQQVKANDRPPLEKDSDVRPVIEAYMNPKCHAVDSDLVCRVLKTQSFDRARLQEICSQFFGWPSEKTDEYILPRIAERELRRFANLRLSSSHLGAALPLDMMPIRCPLSEVIKHRKAQGRDCFEVSWEEFDGLKTSIVPADLVESACHEKVAEFEERKAQKRKQNCRKAKTKKSCDTASMANVDSKLQSLLLDIESDDNARSNTTLQHVDDIPKKSEDTAFKSGQCDGSGLARLANGLCDKNSTHQPGPIDSVDLTAESPVLDIESKYNARHKLTSWSSSSASRINIEVDLTVSDTLLDEEHERSIHNRPCVDSQSDLPSRMETDVVDLLSPSPVISTRYVSKCQGNVEQATVIDLSDSDMEISPEHAQKARELRQFLTSIRKEIF